LTEPLGSSSRIRAWVGRSPCLWSSLAIRRAFSFTLAMRCIFVSLRCCRKRAEIALHRSGHRSTRLDRETFLTARCLISISPCTISCRWAGSTIHSSSYIPPRRAIRFRLRCRASWRMYCFRPAVTTRRPAIAGNRRTRVRAWDGARLGQGRLDEAIQLLRPSAGSLDQAYLGNALARDGRRDEAERLAGAAGTHPFQQALIFAGDGDKDRAFEALN
jgi:hypothetical protein